MKLSIYCKLLEISRPSLVVFIIGISGINIFISGQSLIDTISSSTANLTSSEAIVYQALRQDSFTKDIKLVSFGNPVDYMDSGKIIFTLPITNDTIIAKLIDIIQTDTSFGWIYRMANQKGFLAIHETHGLRGAWIQTEQKFFEIMPIKSGVYTFRETNLELEDSIDCIGPEISPRSEDFCEDDYNTCEASIDILVLIPPDVLNWLASKYGSNPFLSSIFLATGCYAIQTAFLNSDIPNKRVYFRGAPFNYIYPSPLDCEVGLKGAGSYSGLNSQASSIRSAYGADLVVLLTARNFTCGAGAAIGNPSDGGEPAYAIVEIPWFINPRWTFAHEVGHLLSARHSRTSPGPGDDDSSDCGHGWTVDGNRFQRTLMAPWFGTQTPTDIRILHYSNPDVNYPIDSDDPTGTSTSNNALSIRNAACSVSDYMQTAFFSVNISGPIWVCYYDDYINMSAIVNVPTFGHPGYGPYSYEWRWSYTGDFENDPSYLFSTSTSAQLATPPSGVDEIWIRLKVTSSDNVVEYSYRQVLILDSNSHHCHSHQSIASNDGQSQNEELFEESSPSNLISEENGKQISILTYPNPAFNYLSVSIRSNQESTAEIIISNIFNDGVLDLKNQNLLKGNNEIEINISNLPIGFYTISIISESNVKSNRFVINRE